MKKTVVFLSIATLAISSCMWHGRRVRGNGNVITENMQVGDFSGVDLSCDFDVYLSEGGTSSVKIEAEENIMRYIQIHVENGVLQIESEHNIWLNPRRDVKIFVTAPHFNKVFLTSSGNITGQTKITDPDNLKVSITGSGNIKLDVDAPEVTAEVTGSGDLQLAGETKKFSGEIMGSGDMKALDLKAEDSRMEITGSGNADLYASVRLDASITGSGDIRYKGPAQLNKNRTGSGDVRKID